MVFDEQCQHILAMCSLEGEIVPLKQPVHISSLVEVTKIPFLSFRLGCVFGDFGCVFGAEHYLVTNCRCVS